MIRVYRELGQAENLVTALYSNGTLKGEGNGRYIQYPRRELTLLAEDVIVSLKRVDL